MKRFFWILPAFCLLIACSKERDGVSDGLRDLSFSVSSEAGVKSSYFGTGSLMWSDGDRLSVFDGVANREFLTVDSGAQVRFFGKVAEEAASLVAVYPYDIRHSFSAPGTLSLMFPYFQEAVPGGFTDGANPSVGTFLADSGESLEMKNIGSYLKFTIPESESTIEAVYIESNSSESLSGSVSVDVSGPVPVSEQAGGYSFVTLVPENGRTVIAPGSYYAVVNPVTLQAGLSLTFRRSDGKVGVKKGTAQNILERNSSKDLGTINPDTMEWTSDPAYADSTVTLDFAAAPFTESLPSTKTTGLKTYFTPDGLPFTFWFDPEPDSPNTRGIGWQASSVRLVLYASTYYGSQETASGLDRLTLPTIPGKRLRKVSLSVGGSNSFQAYVVDSDWELVSGGKDTNPDNWNASGNWLSGKTIEFNLSGTVPDAEYHIVAAGKSTFVYIAQLELVYETIRPAHPSSDIQGAEISSLGETGTFVWE